MQKKIKFVSVNNVCRMEWYYLCGFFRADVVKSVD